MPPAPLLLRLPRALAAALVVAACNATPAGLPLRIGFPTQPAALLLAIAEHQGLLDASGLDATLVAYPSSQGVLAALDAGDLGAGVVSTAELAARTRAGDGLRLLASVGVSDDDVWLAVHRDRGSTDWSDLRGRRIGLPPGAGTWRGAEVLLGQAGLAPPAWTGVPLPRDSLPLALLRGDVDAVAVRPPLPPALHEGPAEGVRVLRQPGVYRHATALVVPAASLRGNPEPLTRLLRGLIAAEERIGESPAVLVEALDALGDAPAGRSADRLLLRVSFPGGMLRALETQRAWAVRRGLVPPAQPGELRDLLAPALLAEVRPEAVVEPW